MNGREKKHADGYRHKQLVNVGCSPFDGEDHYAGEEKYEVHA